MWKEDSIIDDLKLDDTTIKMARIHSKYLELLTITKMRRKKKDLEYKEARDYLERVWSRKDKYSKLIK